MWKRGSDCCLGLFWKTKNFQRERAGRDPANVKAPSLYKNISIPTISDSPAGMYNNLCDSKMLWRCASMPSTGQLQLEPIGTFCCVASSTCSSRGNHQQPSSVRRLWWRNKSTQTTSSSSFLWCHFGNAFNQIYSKRKRADASEMRVSTRPQLLFYDDPVQLWSSAERCGSHHQPNGSLQRPIT